MERNIKDSQNFMHDLKLVEDIVGKSNISSNDIVFEIGPGEGIITEILKNKAKEVIAIEYDQNLYEKLLEKFKNYKNIKIINSDFITYELPVNYNYKIFSNIPFNLTSNIFKKTLTNYQNITDFYFIMQYEAALNYMGIPNESFKSLLFKPIFESKIIYEFKNTDFKPTPNVKIVLVHFHKKEFCDIKNAPINDYWDLVAYLFSNTGVNFKEKTKLIFTYEQQKRIKKSIKIEFESSITSWTYNNWLNIFNAYNTFVNQEKKNIVKNSYSKLRKNQSNLDKVYRTRKY